MKRAGDQIVLVGTYRPENADWIAAKRLYNLPLPKCGKLAFHARVGGLPDDWECVSAPVQLSISRIDALARATSLSTSEQASHSCPS